jgi:hypothetical protein
MERRVAIRVANFNWHSGWVKSAMIFFDDQGRLNFSELFGTLRYN